MEVVDQRGIGARLADQQLIDVFAIAIAHPGAAELVVVQVALHALGQIGRTDQPAQVVGTEPALVFQQHGTQQALVADEYGGDQDLFRHGAPPGRRAKRAGTAKHLRGEGWGVKGISITSGRFLGRDWSRELRNPPETGRTYSPCGSCISPLPTARVTFSADVVRPTGAKKPQKLSGAVDRSGFKAFLRRLM